MAARSGTTRGRRTASEPPASDATGDRERPHVCSVAFCPIGLALTGAQVAGGTDAVEHLLAAAREFFLAAKAVVDARAADVQRATSGEGLQRIEIA
jgi:hypothetical protein